MKRLLATLIVPLLLSQAAPAAADEPGRYGSIWLGPRLGPGIGIRGPRGGYYMGLQLSYRSPHYFYYNLEVGFQHLLPRTITVDPTISVANDGTETVLVPEHEARVSGLYSIPMTLDVGLRFAHGRARFRVGVGLGAMISVQTKELFELVEAELIASFCVRPNLGVDIVSRSGNRMVMIDLLYLWQDADFEQTDDDNTVDTFLITIGYSWQLLE